MDSGNKNGTHGQLCDIGHKPALWPVFWFWL